MAPTEFHRYADNRGDTIIFKFDPQVASEPDPKWPNDSPITVYQHYIITKSNGTANYHSDLLPLELAIERSRTDKPASQPTVGKVMYTVDSSANASADAKTKTQYVWKGWSYGEGYWRGWAKLLVRAFDRVPPVLRVVQGQLQRDVLSGTEKAKCLFLPPVKKRPGKKRVRKDSVGEEFSEDGQTKGSNGISTPEDNSGASRDPSSFSESSENTETISNNHEIEVKKNKAKSESVPLDDSDVEIDLEHLFAEMPMLLYAVKKTGGLKQFCASLVNPKAIQIFEAFMSKITGAAPLLERRTVLKGKKWDYWVIKYKERLAV